MNKKIEDKLRAAFGNQLAIGSIQKYPRLIDMNIIKKFRVKFQDGRMEANLRPMKAAIRTNAFPKVL